MDTIAKTENTTGKQAPPDTVKKFHNLYRLHTIKGRMYTLYEQLMAAKNLMRADEWDAYMWHFNRAEAHIHSITEQLDEDIDSIIKNLSGVAS